MGAQHSCPTGFERSVFLTCTAICPPDFEKQRSERDRCVHIRRSNVSVSLREIPYNAPSSAQVPPEPPAFQAERNRVIREIERARKRVDNDIERERLLREAEDAKRLHVNEVSRIQSEYASYTSVADAAASIRTTQEQLRKVRPPTAPASDLDKERREISEIAKRNMFFVQVALALVVVALLGYLVLPIEYAHGIAFLLLCVGISVGFFLRRG